MDWFLPMLALALTALAAHVGSEWVALMRAQREDIERRRRRGDYGEP